MITSVWIVSHRFHKSIITVIIIIIIIIIIIVVVIIIIIIVVVIVVIIVVVVIMIIMIMIMIIDQHKLNYIAVASPYNSLFLQYTKEEDRARWSMYLSIDDSNHLRECTRRRWYYRINAQSYNADESVRAHDAYVCRNNACMNVAVSAQLCTKKQAYGQAPHTFSISEC